MEKTIDTLRQERRFGGGKGLLPAAAVVRPLGRRRGSPTGAGIGPLLGCLLGCVFACVLTGCTVGPKYRPPVIQPPPAFKQPPAEGNETWTVAQPQDAKIRGDWWAIFNDPELNTLEGQLNIDNQNIKVAFENFMEARALVGEARALYYPGATASPGYTRSRSSGNLRNTSSANTGQQSNIYQLPLDISWAPDLWGRVRNTVHEAQYSAQVSAADLESEKLTEQVSLAQYFFEIRGQDALIQLYAETIANDKKALDLTQALYDSGIDSYISVVEAKTTLQSAQSSATNLGILRAQYEHAIAVLVGQAAPNFSIPVRPVTPAPPSVPIGIPSQLLERRPDIAASERLMAVENAQIGVAYSAFYPSLTLSAGGGTQSSTLAHLLDWPSRFWSIGGSISAPVFQKGLSAALHQNVAVYNADVASYRQTVLAAFQQVEDSLAATRILSAQIQYQQQTVASAQQALDLEMTRYQTGIDPYIDVVNLQSTLLTSQQTLNNLRVNEMTSAVQLVGNLGGGWDRTQLPTTEQVSATPPKADTTMQH